MLKVSNDLGYRRRGISAEEIVERCLLALVNEGARILQEGIAADSTDIDRVWLNGYGFPAATGGPMRWADDQGAAFILARLEYLQSVLGEHWRPAGLLYSMVAKGKRFDQLAEAQA